MRIRVAYTIWQRSVWCVLCRSGGSTQGHRCVGIVHAGRLETGHLRRLCRLRGTHRLGHGRGGCVAAIRSTAAIIDDPGELLAVTAHGQRHRAAVHRIVELLLRHCALHGQRGAVDDIRIDGIRIETGHAHVGAATVRLLLYGRLWWTRWRLAADPGPNDNLQFAFLARMNATRGFGGCTLRRRCGVRALRDGVGIAAWCQRFVGNTGIGATQAAGCGAGGDLVARIEVIESVRRVT